ncbi:MAG: hypothetical protein H0S80_12405 [Desulfovibrionaceae bacterium]|nr:hypothetical protein [Desulfovibrionaceae bacterium]
MRQPSSTNRPPFPDGRANRRAAWRGLLLAPLAALVLLLCTAAPCPAHETYHISFSPGAEIHILARERVRDMYQRAGMAVEFVPMPHKRSIQSAAEGTVDGEVGRIKGLEKRHPGLRRVDVKLIDLTGAAYVIEGSAIQHYDRKLLDTVRVGAVNGVQWALRELDGRPAEMVSDYTRLFGMLVENRVDMVLGSTLSTEAVLNKEGIRNRRIRKLTPLVYCAPLYHYVNEKHADIIPLLEQALRELWAEDHWGGDGPCVPGAD